MSTTDREGSWAPSPSCASRCAALSSNRTTTGTTSSVVYNAMHDRHPALIVRWPTPPTSIAVVDYARETGLDLAVRGGGHSVPGFGTCDGGVVIDLGRCNNVFVDPGRRTARVGGGATWATSTTPRTPSGWPRRAGSSRPPASAGLTLGGGIGYLARRYGLSCDNLLSAPTS